MFKRLYIVKSKDKLPYPPDRTQTLYTEKSSYETLLDDWLKDFDREKNFYSITIYTYKFFDQFHEDFRLANDLINGFNELLECDYLVSISKKEFNIIKFNQLKYYDKLIGGL